MHNKNKNNYSISNSSWFNHFKSLLYNDNNENIALENLMQNYNAVDNLFNDPFMLQELEESVKSLKLGKSTGPSRIISETIKASFNQTPHILLKLCNRIFETGQFPSSWGQSILCPFFKAGSINDPNNYQGIFLIDTLNKILTGMMFNQLLV